MKIDLGKTITSKTIWLGILTILVGIVEYLNGVPVGASAGTVIIGVFGVIIRFLTKDSLIK